MRAATCHFLKMSLWGLFVTLISISGSIRSCWKFWFMDVNLGQDFTLHIYTMSESKKTLSRRITKFCCLLKLRDLKWHILNVSIQCSASRRNKIPSKDWTSLDSVRLPYHWYLCSIRSASYLGISLFLGYGTGRLSVQQICYISLNS